RGFSGVGAGDVVARGLLVEGVLRRARRPSGRSRLQSARHAVRARDRGRIRSTRLGEAGVAVTELIETATAAARAGGAVLLRSWRALPEDSGEEKQKNDFVTQADRDSEAAIIERIREDFPDDAFLGEEGGVSGGKNAKRTWIIDPLDGTSNFVSGFPFWSVSIAVRQGEELVVAAVWDPLREEMYAAEGGSGASRNGTAVRVTDRRDLDGAFLATGFPFRHREKIDLYLSLFRE